jgi:hypothetical protein
MNKAICVFGCGLILLLQVPGLSLKSVGALAREEKHGGKIEVTYDGFNHETVLSLRKMRISCDGIKDAFKGKSACVSLMVSLHCRGTQAFHVNYVNLQLVFETKAWDQGHPLNQRDLSVVVNNETLRLGQMNLVSQSVDENLTETLGITFPYEVFKKITQGQFVEMQVGRSRFALREKNLDALRDLNTRVVAAK